MPRILRNILAIVGIALVVGAIVMITREKPEDALMTSAVSSSTMPIVQFALTGLDRESWPLASKAEGYIASLTPDQRITPMVITDPTDSSIVYFATTANIAIDEDEAVLVSVYRYKTPTHEFERLYRRTYRQGEALGLNKNAWPLLSAVGYDDGQLVLMLQDATFSPDPCMHPLLTGLDNESATALYSLDLGDPLAGLARYTPPDTSVIEAQAAQDACLADND